jgi:hypothetical protein
MNESKPTCGWNESKPPTLGLLRDHPPVQSPLDRLFCGGCAQFDREAWETVKTLLSTIEELREELAQARNALANSH